MATIIDIDPIIAENVTPIRYVASEIHTGATSTIIRPLPCSDHEKTPGIWQVLSVAIKIECDANVANRTGWIGIGGEALAYPDTVQSVAITANQNVVFYAGRYSVFSNCAPPIHPTAGGLSYYAGVEHHWGILSTKSSWLTSYLVNAQAGDTHQVFAKLLCLNRLWNILPDKYRRRI